MTALIGFAGSGIGGLFGVLASARVTQYRINQLEKKVQAHNNLVERTYQVEGRLGKIESAMAGMSDTIEKLEGFHLHA